ncbi:NAD-dependent epimerase/dehydratase family protein [Halomicrobium katesii]|uniref:NAD-dependent epimerase/dehydratase family protein n=1 Tax=Halomicrobium katesii TaxID=437163 RepID=UPI00047822FB|nr:NAD-dependent epimerase/dehydratase family protein [Halomicrobium katesii]
MDSVLVTGGAGFVGSHLVDRLVEQGYEVIVLDNFSEQVHSGEPDYLNPDAEYVRGDIRERDVISDLLRRVDMVSHQASAVGISQSMYEIERYVDTNTLATARLFDVIVNEDVDLKKFVVASSMSLYGEGLYRCQDCNDTVSPDSRSPEQMEARDWEQRCPDCGAVIEPIGTPETMKQSPNSVYAITKQDQEQLALSIGETYDIPVVALRYFNVYGSRQSLDNPYTGVCSIFSNRIQNDNPPIVYEDGKQSRDFVHVSDVARANQLALERDEADGLPINVGSDSATTILEIAEMLLELHGKSSLDLVVGEEFRHGDIRHCTADISRAKETLDFEPQVDFYDGLAETVAWASDQETEDRFEEMQNELKEKGLSGTE